MDEERVQRREYPVGTGISIRVVAVFSSGRRPHTEPHTSGDSPSSGDSELETGWEWRDPSVMRTAPDSLPTERGFTANVLGSARLSLGDGFFMWKDQSPLVHVKNESKH